ncbi:MAG: 1,4-beta cellobiohydrolase, partial [Frankiales bacterium]|nr:1,4-beta cellobiohydrolase [Frankiales bacterium]
MLPRFVAPLSVVRIGRRHDEEPAVRPGSGLRRICLVSALAVAAGVAPAYVAVSARAPLAQEAPGPAGAADRAPAGEAVPDSAVGGSALAVVPAGTSIVKAAAVVPAATNPFAGKSLYAAPLQGAELRLATGSALLTRLGAVPQAVWLGGTPTQVAAQVDAVVGAASAVGKLPVLVAYNIPGRDCNSYSAGGAADAAA